MFTRSLRLFVLLGAIITFTASVFTSCTDPMYIAEDYEPVIHGFSPPNGAAGSTVIIKGKNFSPVKEQNTVKFNGLTAEVVSSTTGELTVLAPAGVTTGKISVTVRNVTVTSASDFTVDVQAPVITSITPGSGMEGTVVEITGSNFSAGTKVYFGAIEATEITVVSSTKITVKVPSGVVTANIKIVSNGKEAVSPEKFYTQPKIISFAPEKAKQGEIITITGSNFSEIVAENIVRFGNVVLPVTDITEATSTTLKVKAPAGVFNNKISVEVKGMNAESTQSFMILPTAAGYTPTSGSSGTLVTLTGSNMAPDAEIYIGNVKVTSFEPGRTTDKIEFKVPALATGGKIIIKQAGVDTEFGEFGISNVWQKITEYTTGNVLRFEVARGVTFTYNNKIYYGYGYDDINAMTYTNELAAFDMTTFAKTVIHPNDAAATGRPKPKLISISSYVVFNDKLYLFGGATKQGWDKEVWELDLATNTYVKKAVVLPDAIQGFYASFVVNGEIYIYLYNNAAQKSQIYKYNPATDVITHYMDMALGNRSDFQVEVMGSKAYFIAGIGGSVGAKNIIEVDIPAKTTKTFPIAGLVSYDLMGNFVSFAHNGKLYFGGGWCGTCWSGVPQNRNEFYVFDPQASALTRLDDMPVHPTATYALPFGIKNGALYILTVDGMFRYMP
jgi:hypothetical protein